MQSTQHHRHGRWTRRGILATVAVVAAMAIPASATASGITAELHAPGHTMSIAKGKTWKYTVDVKHNGKKINGKIRYQFYVPVLAATEYTQKWQKFSKGVYHSTLKPWTNARTKLAVGFTLTFRVQVDTKYGDKTINYSVKITT